jgi:hypothetical protein
VNIEVDISARFNRKGMIRPDYIQLTDTEGQSFTYKILQPKFLQVEKFAGTTALLFSCYIQVNDRMQPIKIKYHANTYQWVLVQ